jgi:hypothetical protein
MPLLTGQKRRKTRHSTAWCLSGHYKNGSAAPTVWREPFVARNRFAIVAIIPKMRILRILPQTAPAEPGAARTIFKHTILSLELLWSSFQSFLDTPHVPCA